MASNGRYLNVVQPARLENIGWEIRVRDNIDFTTLVAVVPDFITLSVGPELNASGAGSATFNLDSPFWHSLLGNGRSAMSLRDYEYLWEAWEDGNLRFQWLGRNIEESPVDDTESRSLTVSGPGGAEVLRMAQILRPGFPKAVPKNLKPEFASGSDKTAAYKWIFPPKWAAMRMWITLLNAAQRRGTIPWIKPKFTPYVDSGRTPWEYYPTVASETKQGFSPEVGKDLFDFLNDCTGQDYSTYFAEPTEWVMWPGFKLDVRKTIGTHREKKVIFYESRIAERTRTRSREEIRNVVVVVDNAMGMSTVTDAASVNKWNRREMFYTEGASHVTQPDRRTKVAKSVLKQNKEEKDEWTIVVPANDLHRRPFYDYNIGDWVGFSNWSPSVASTVSAYRILAMVVTVEGETPTVELTLQSKMQYRLLQLQKALTYFLNHAGKGITLPDVTTRNQDDTQVDTGNATFGNQGFADGIRVFIQDDDPGVLARPGDFWYDTSYTPEGGYTYDPETPLTFDLPTNSPLLPLSSLQSADLAPAITYRQPPLDPLASLIPAGG